MRILLDQGIYDMRNIGNTAKLQVLASRLKQFWPEASLDVITYGSNLLKIYIPNSNPITPNGYHGISKNRVLGRRILQLIPKSFWRFLFEMREKIWLNRPGLQTRFRASSSHQKNDEMANANGVLISENIAAFSKMILGTDLFIATGCAINDVSMDSAIQVLYRLQAAVNLGIPTAIVSPVIGPIDEPKLREIGKSILPSVDLIFAREKLETPNVLNSLGVDPAKVFLTGDDAIELAYNARQDKWGTGIGVSIRVMPYTRVNDNHIQLIGEVIKQVAQKYRAKLIGIPISMSIHERDDKHIGQLLEGYKNIKMNGWSFQPPLEVIYNIQQCRIVVTGTYHAALFALAQGIPAVCLANSVSYVNKFSGLADLFNHACEVIILDEEKLKEKLLIAVDNAWQSAEKKRPMLLECAAQQVEWGRAAYQNLYNLVDLSNAR